MALPLTDFYCPGLVTFACTNAAMSFEYSSHWQPIFLIHGYRFNRTANPGNYIRLRIVHRIMLLFYLISDILQFFDIIGVILNAPFALVL